MTKLCSNCKSPRRPVKRGRFCRRCSYWHSKAERLRREIRLLSDTVKRSKPRHFSSLKYRLRKAVRVLEEYRWREVGRTAEVVASKRIRSLIYALVAAARTSADEVDVARIVDLPAPSRKVLHDIILSMVENLPTKCPVLHMNLIPRKGAYYSGGWLDWMNEYWLLASQQREALDKTCLESEPPA